MKKKVVYESFRGPWEGIAESKMESGWVVVQPAQGIQTDEEGSQSYIYLDSTPVILVPLHRIYHVEGA